MAMFLIFTHFGEDVCLFREKEKKQKEEKLKRRNGQQPRPAHAHTHELLLINVCNTHFILLCMTLISASIYSRRPMLTGMAHGNPHPIIIWALLVRSTRFSIPE